MADRRVLDLSYGHVGDASYDINEGKWNFSVDTSRNQIFKQVAPFKETIPAAIRNVPKTTGKLQRIARSHMKWVVKARPEVYPANTIASTLAKSSATQREYPPSYGQLIAIGGAVDADRRSGNRAHSVIAIPCGDAGHVLRLIRPQGEYHGWSKHSSAKLPLLDAASGDIAFWVGTGGTIRQIAVSSDEHGSGTLLATRHDFLITIFRPMYHKHPVQATTPSGYAKQYPPSRLAANPVAILKPETLGSGLHADISFNPFYDRQFAVVDDAGNWSIWDTEGWTRKNARNAGLELVRGKSGGLHDGFAVSSHGEGHDTVGGWHRILWVANVSTIVICSRSHIAAFDVKSTPSRLPGPDRLSIKTNDWILDIKRSPLNKSQIFILTTYRVFWIEVIASGGQKGPRDAGIRVILSYRHFRDVSDETLSLTVLHEEDVSVLVSSSKTLLINFYTFSERSSAPTSFQGSFSFSTEVNNQVSSNEMLQAMCFLRAPLTSTPGRTPGPELELVKQNVKFYQVWTLTPSLALRWTLCAMYDVYAGSSPPKVHITAPTVRLFLRRLLASGDIIVDHFIVPDDFASGDEDDSTLVSQNHKHHQQFEKTQVHLQPWLDWRGVFHRLFVDNTQRNQIDTSLINSFQNMPELVDSVLHRIDQGMGSGSLPMASLLELSQLTDFEGDLQESTPILHDFLEMLQANRSTHETVDLVLSDLNSCPGIGFVMNDDSTFSGLLGVYDEVGEHWMASLPMQVSNLARLSKFRVARKVAVELCLSLIAVSIRNRSSQPKGVPPSVSKIDLPPSGEEQNDAGIMAASDMATGSVPEAGFSLPTLSRTPSVYSHVSNDTSDVSEDPLISRLGQYAVFIKSRPDLGESALLSQWPSAPGADPAKYSWQSMVDELEDESDSRRRREEERRRRRTEKFLNRERMNESLASSQLTVLRSGSQPEPVLPAAISQSVSDVPMTQPDRGIFGARFAKPGKKKKGKRRAAGF